MIHEALFSDDGLARYWRRKEKFVRHVPEIDPNYVSARQPHRNLLMLAAQDNRPSIMKVLLSRPRLEVNATDRAGWSPLYYAAVNGAADCLRLLLAVPGIEVDARVNVMLDTALHAATDHDHVGCVEALLEDGRADVNAAAVDGCAPLHLAARNACNRSMELLLSVPGVDVNRRSAEMHGKWTPLETAVLEKNAFAVRALLAHADVRVNLRGVSGMTAAHVAAIVGNAPIMRMILGKKRVRLNSRRLPDGRTPLHSASLAGHHRIVRLLLEKSSVDVNALDAEGRTALHTAVISGHVNVVEEILKHPQVEVDTLDDVGTGSIHFAAFSHNLGILDRLLNAGADLNLQDAHGYTPLHVGAANGHIGVLATLHSRPGLNYGGRTRGNATALHLAAVAGQSIAVAFLIERPGLDVNAAGDFGLTALHLATLAGHLETVKNLLRAFSINVYAVDNEGRTASDIARRRGFREIQCALASHANRHRRCCEALYQQHRHLLL